MIIFGIIMDAFKTARKFLGNDIPEVQGLYYFRPGLFRKSALGLRGNSNYSIEQLNRAKYILEKNISRLANLYSDRSLMGSIKEGFYPVSTDGLKRL